MYFVLVILLILAGICKVRNISMIPLKYLLNTLITLFGVAYSWDNNKYIIWKFCDGKLVDRCGSIDWSLYLFFGS